MFVKCLGGEQLEKVYEGTGIKKKNAFFSFPESKPFIQDKTEALASTKVVLQDYSLLHYFHSYWQPRNIPPSTK